MITHQEIYDYLKLYPACGLSLGVFRNMDKTAFTEKEHADWNECNKFIQKHKRYAICPNPFARHPLYSIGIRAKVAHEQSCGINYEVKGDRIFLINARDYRGHDISDGLIDYVITPDRDLRLGQKHYWLAEGHTFVYGAGRLMVSDTGVVSYIDNHSGHFTPSNEAFTRSLELLSDLKIKHVNYINIDT